MIRLIMMTAFVFLGASAFAAEPTNKTELCKLATFDESDPQLPECYVSPASLENMNACLNSTLMFGTFMDCIRLVSVNTITPEKIKACGEGTLMRSRFLACVGSANDPEVTLAEVKDCEQFAQENGEGAYHRGRLFVACVEKARTSSAEIVKTLKTDQPVVTQEAAVKNRVTTSKGDGTR